MGEVGVERLPECALATVAEVAAPTDAMPGRPRLLVALATWCQLRRGELFGPRRRDVDVLHSSLSEDQLVSDVIGARTLAGVADRRRATRATVRPRSGRSAGGADGSRAACSSAQMLLWGDGSVLTGSSPAA